MQALKMNDSHSESFEDVTRRNCYHFLTYWVSIDMVLIPRRNIASLSFEIDLNDIRNNIRCKHPKQTHISSNFELFHVSNVLVIFNQMSSYLYGIYSQTKYSNFFNWNRFGVWIELWDMRTSRTNDSAPQISYNSQEHIVLISQPNEVLLIWSLLPAWIKQDLHLKSIWSPEDINPHANLKWIAQIYNQSRLSHE
jgi:hypothetical protein